MSARLGLCGYALLSGFACALSGTVNAAERPWYLIGKVGFSEFDLADEFRDSVDLPGARFAGDERDVALQLGLGYQPSRNLAIELSYGDYGQSELSATAELPPLQVDSTVDTSALALDLLGILPVNDALSLFAKVGIVRWDVGVESNVLDLSAGGSTRFSDDATGTSAKVGVGVRYALSDQLTLGAEFEQFKAGDDDLSTEDQLRSASVSLQFRF